jgi:hypothetical protein
MTNRQMEKAKKEGLARHLTADDKISDMEKH